MREKTGKQINVPLDKIIIITTSKPKKKNRRQRERERASFRQEASEKKRDFNNKLPIP